MLSIKNTDRPGKAKKEQRKGKTNNLPDTRNKTGSRPERERMNQRGADQGSSSERKSQRGHI